jgi:translation initiation factor IF-1
VIGIEGGGMYRIELSNGKKILAKTCGKMRKFRIRVILGDFVTVGISPYDPNHGLILYRHKGQPKKAPKTTS